MQSSPFIWPLEPVVPGRGPAPDPDRSPCWRPSLIKESVITVCRLFFVNVSVPVRLHQHAWRLAEDSHNVFPCFLLPLLGCVLTSCVFQKVKRRFKCFKCHVDFVITEPRWFYLQIVWNVAVTTAGRVECGDITSPLISPAFEAETGEIKVQEGLTHLSEGLNRSS